MDVEYLKETICKWKREIVVALLLIVVTVLAVKCQGRPDFKATFLAKCQEHHGYDCLKIWDAFQQAYVNKDPCKVPVEAYDPLIAAAPFERVCNRMLFWSKLKYVACSFTEKNDCYINLDKTLLGSLLDGLTWCGKDGSKGLIDCENNPVRSFWNRTSAAFADAACGTVPVILSGSVDNPFDPTSTFASVEVKRFKAPTVTNLKVYLMTGGKNLANCTHPSLKDLRKELDPRIHYSCTEVPGSLESQIEACPSNSMAPCGTVAQHSLFMLLCCFLSMKIHF